VARSTLPDNSNPVVDNSTALVNSTSPDNSTSLANSTAVDNSTAVVDCAASNNTAAAAVTNANKHVKKAKKALKAMEAGGKKKNAVAADEVSGNLTLAMDQLAAVNSYVEYFFPVLFCRPETEFGPAWAFELVVRQMGRS
jgi:hypothetical protein